ncbi:MAG: hypothetical protein R3Y64_11345 [Peptostreptococcaceae bacterium]
MKLNNKGYVSIEVIIAVGILISMLIGAMYTFKDKSEKITESALEKIEEATL